MNHHVINAGRVRLASEALWDTLENQRPPKINRLVRQAWDESLSDLMPVLRRNRYIKTSEGLSLLQATYSYCPELCQNMLAALGYPKIQQDLIVLGYHNTRAKFMQKCAEYAQEQGYNRWFTR